MKKKMPAGGPPQSNVLRAGKHSRTGKAVRRYLNSQLWIPALDEEAAWADSEKLFPGEK